MLTYLWKLLNKRAYWREQQRWSLALKERLIREVPPDVKVVAQGWHAGCAPLFQVERLEWVQLERSVSEHVRCGSIPWFYPEYPTALEVKTAIERLELSLVQMGGGIIPSC